MAEDPLAEPGSSGKAAAKAGAAHGEAQLAHRLLHGLQRRKSFCYEHTPPKRSFYDFLDGEELEEKRRQFESEKICSLSVSLKGNQRPIFKCWTCYLILKAPLL